MRSVNALRMFSECLETTNLHMHISFWQMYGEHSANVRRAFAENVQCPV